MSEHLYPDLGTFTNLTCGECGRDCDDLYSFRYCNWCWYTIVGGDLAPDWALAIPPSFSLGVERTTGMVFATAGPPEGTDA